MSILKYATAESVAAMQSAQQHEAAVRTEGDRLQRELINIGSQISEKCSPRVQPTVAAARAYLGNAALAHPAAAVTQGPTLQELQNIQAGLKQLVKENQDDKLYAQDTVRREFFKMLRQCAESAAEEYVIAATVLKENYRLLGSVHGMLLSTSNPQPIWPALDAPQMFRIPANSQLKAMKKCDNAFGQEVLADGHLMCDMNHRVAAENELRSEAATLFGACPV